MRAWQQLQPITDATHMPAPFLIPCMQVSGDNKGVAEAMAEAWAAGRTMFSSNTSEGTDSKAARVSATSTGSTSSGGGGGSRGGGSSGGFIAAFAQGAVGDTSPNTQGPFCIDTGGGEGRGPGRREGFKRLCSISKHQQPWAQPEEGRHPRHALPCILRTQQLPQSHPLLPPTHAGEPCDNPTSTCGGRNEMCHGRGPAWPDDSRSTEVIGRLQAEAAQALYEAAQVLKPCFPLCAASA